jgi:hypothetical protein
VSLLLRARHSLRRPQALLGSGNLVKNAHQDHCPQQGGSLPAAVAMEDGGTRFIMIDGLPPKVRIVGEPPQLSPIARVTLECDSTALVMSLADVVRQRLYNSAPLTKENKDDHRG